MRMNPLEGVTAAEWLAEASERELTRVFWEFGEERHARRIARSIDDPAATSVGNDQPIG